MEQSTLDALRNAEEMLDAAREENSRLVQLGKVCCLFLAEIIFLTIKSCVAEENYIVMKEKQIERT